MSNHNDDLSADPLEPERFAPSSEGLQEHVIAPGEQLDARDIHAKNVVVGTQVNIEHQYIYQGAPLPPARQKPIFMAADRPVDFVARSREFDALKQSILQNNTGQETAITSMLIGAGGYGKSTLALALCHDDDVRARFRDGILWVTLGEQSPNLIGKIEDLLYLLVQERPGFTSVEAATTALKDALARGQYLLVIDDVWRTADLIPFVQGGPSSARLITSRLTSVLSSATQQVPVNAMSQEEANQLLQKKLESVVEEAKMERDFQRLASQLGKWPLLLTLVNGVLYHRIIRQGERLSAAFSYLQRALAKRGVLAFDTKNPSSRSEAVAQTIEVSLLQLDADERKRYEKLAIFPDDVNIPLETVSQFWRTTVNFDELDTEEFCQRLYGLSLLLSYDLKNRQIRLHDMIRNYLQLKMAALLVALHQQFLDSYTLASWAGLSLEEPYLWEHLAKHLLAADRKEELHMTLMDVSFLEALIRRSGVAGVQKDFGLASEDRTLRQIASAVRAGVVVLRQRPEELWNQVKGRVDITLQASLPRQTPRFDLRYPSLIPADEALMHVFEGHSHGVNSCAFSPDGQQILSASVDSTLRLWDVANGASLRAFKADTSLDFYEEVFWCAFSPDGQQVLGASGQHWGRDGKLWLWDVTNEAIMKSFYDSDSMMCGCAFSPNGQQVLSASSVYFDSAYDSWFGENTLCLWDIASSVLLHVFKGHSNSVLGCAFSPDGRQVLSASADRTLRLWDVTSGTVLRVFEGHSNSVLGCAFSPDGQQILSASQDGTLRLWDVSAVSVQRLWEVTTMIKKQKERVLVRHSNSVLGCAFSSDGQQALSASKDGTLRLWDVASGTILRAFEGHRDWVWGCALSPNGRQALSASIDGTLRLWDVTSGNALRIISAPLDDFDVPAYVGRDCAFSQDGSQYISAWTDGSLRLWSVSSETSERTFYNFRDSHQGSANSCAFSSDGQQILSAYGDLEYGNETTLRLWHISIGITSIFKGHKQMIWSCAFSPDDRQVLSASEDGTLRLWDVASGASLRVFEGHTDGVRGCAFSPDGQQVLSASEDGTLRLWAVTSGRELARWTTDAKLYCCAISSDGKTVVAGDETGGFHFLSLITQ